MRHQGVLADGSVGAGSFLGSFDVLSPGQPMSTVAVYFTYQLTPLISTAGLVPRMRTLPVVPETVK